MSKKNLVLYTMDGCTYCTELKESLDKQNISYIERDIDENEEEYEFFVRINEGNRYVPAFMIFDSAEGKVFNPRSFLPDRDFYNIDEASSIIKEVILENNGGN